MQSPECLCRHTVFSLWFNFLLVDLLTSHFDEFVLVSDTQALKLPTKSGPENTPIPISLDSFFQNLKNIF